MENVKENVTYMERNLLIFLRIFFFFNLFLFLKFFFLEVSVDLSF